MKRKNLDRIHYEIKHQACHSRIIILLVQKQRCHLDHPPPVFSSIGSLCSESLFGNKLYCPEHVRASAPAPVARSSCLKLAPRYLDTIQFTNKLSSKHKLLFSCKCTIYSDIYVSYLAYTSRMPNILICLVSKLWSRFVPLEDDPWLPASRGRCDSNHDYDKIVSQVRNSRWLQEETRSEV